MQETLVLVSKYGLSQKSWRETGWRWDSFGEYCLTVIISDHFWAESDLNKGIPNMISWVLHHHNFLCSYHVYSKWYGIMVITDCQFIGPLICLRIIFLNLQRNPNMQRYGRMMIIIWLLFELYDYYPMDQWIIGVFPQMFFHQSLSRSSPAMPWRIIPISNWLVGWAPVMCVGFQAPLASISTYIYHKYQAMQPIYSFHHL